MSISDWLNQIEARRAQDITSLNMLAGKDAPATTTVYRAYSPTRGKAGATFTEHARAQSQAAVRNQYVECDPNTDALADWHVQTGHVQWETP